MFANLEQASSVIVVARQLMSKICQSASSLTLRGFKDRRIAVRPELPYYYRGRAGIDRQA
jgi:hypothetical protein